MSGKNVKKVVNPLTGRLVDRNGVTYKSALETILTKNNSPTKYRFEATMNSNTNSNRNTEDNNSNNNFYINYHKRRSNSNANSNAYNNTNSLINNSNISSMNNVTHQEFKAILKQLASGKLAKFNI